MKNFVKRAMDLATRNLIQKRGIDYFMGEFTRNIDSYNKKEGSNFKTSEEEVDDFISGVPELKPVRETLIKLIRNARLKAGLPE